jgi:hypothetical protein
MSLVFQNIDPPHPPLRPASVFSPQTKAERGVGGNILEDERHRIALLHEQSLYGLFR